MADNNLLRLGEIYGDMLNKVETISESNLIKKKQKMGKKPGPGSKHPNEVSACNLGNADTTGPANADGFKAPEVDIAPKKHDEDEEFVEKSARKALNNFMTKKSIFDKLFESVINEDDSELKELGIDTSLEGEDTGELSTQGEDDSDSVTFTLDRATAQKLHDVLMSVLGEGEMEGEDEMEGGEEGEMEGGEEDEEVLKDGVPHLVAKNNKAGGADVQVGSGKEGDHTYTDEVEGGKEHNTKPAVAAMTGKNNKVKTTLKPGKSFFKH